MEEVADYLSPLFVSGLCTTLEFEQAQMYPIRTWNSGLLDIPFLSRIQR